MSREIYLKQEAPSICLLCALLAKLGASAVSATLLSSTLARLTNSSLSSKALPLSSCLAEHSSIS